MTNAGIEPRLQASVRLLGRYSHPSVRPQQRHLSCLGYLSSQPRRHFNTTGLVSDRRNFEWFPNTGSGIPGGKPLTRAARTCLQSSTALVCNLNTRCLFLSLAASVNLQVGTKKNLYIFFLNTEYFEQLHFLKLFCPGEEGSTPVCCPVIFTLSEQDKQILHVQRS